MGGEKMSSSQANYNPFEKEVLAVKTAIDHNRLLLNASSFATIVRTDNHTAAALKHTQLDSRPPCGHS